MIPWTVARQAPPSMGFSRQQSWSGLPLQCAPPGDLPGPGIEPVSLVAPALAGGFFTIAPLPQISKPSHLFFAENDLTSHCIEKIDGPDRRALTFSNQI